LTDAVGAIDSLGFYGGIPPRIEDEDVVGGRQVQTDAARLQADEEERLRGIFLKPRDAGGPILDVTIEVLVLDPRRVEALAQDREEAGELREHERLVAFGSNLLEARQQHVELRGRLGDATLVDEAGMAGGLPQPQERFEHQDLRLPQRIIAGLHLSEEAGAIVIPQLVVERALRGIELAHDRLLVLGW
jgi:hypothetical protein